MLISIRDCKYSKKDRQWIEYVYGEYVDSLAGLNTGFFPVISEDSPQKDEIFANWFSNDHTHPLLILKGPDAVGFALVSRPRMQTAGEKPVDFHMSEFFVRKQYRRGGVGRDAATLIFDRFTGEWEIVEYERNPGSVAFWRKVVARYSEGRFRERSRNGEIRQRFRSGPPLPQEP
jgi:predicted acetyltransferase